MKNERILVRLTVSQHNLVEFLHHIGCCIRHKIETSRIIWLLIAVRFGEFVETFAIDSYDNPAVFQNLVVRLEELNYAQIE